MEWTQLAPGEELDPGELTVLIPHLRVFAIDERGADLDLVTEPFNGFVYCVDPDPGTGWLEITRYPAKLG